MSGLDVEALLESTAQATAPPPAEPPQVNDGEDRLKHERSERRDRDRHREGSRDRDRDRDRDRKRRDRSRDRRRDRGTERDEDLISPRSDRGSHFYDGHRSRRRSRSRELDRRHSRRDRRGKSTTVRTRIVARVVTSTVEQAGPTPVLGRPTKIDTTALRAGDAGTEKIVSMTDLKMPSLTVVVGRVAVPVRGARRRARVRRGIAASRRRLN